MHSRRVLVGGACTGCIGPIHNRACFVCNSEFTETVEMCQWSVFVDVCRTEQNKRQPTDCMRKVNTLLANCNLDHSLIRKNIIYMDGF